MCHFDTDSAAGRVCTGGGDMPACQLCPHSPTYWRNTTTEPAAARGADPWDNTGSPDTIDPYAEGSGWHEDRTPVPHPDGDPGGRIRRAMAEQSRCVICNIPTVWTSPKGKRCHPSCATMWARQHGLPITPKVSPKAPA